MSITRFADPMPQLPGAPKNCYNCPIRHRAVCSNCDAHELQRLDQFKSYRTFKAGQTILLSGEEMRFVGSVVTGVATLIQTMADGRRQMVGLLLPSDFVGRPGRNIAPYDVVATTDLVLCCFRKHPFEQMISETPHIADRLLQMTLDELDAAREWMLVLGRKTAREKIASLLTIIGRRNAALSHEFNGGRLEFALPLTRDEMADFLGLTLETVSRQMSALKKDAVISLIGNRHIIVPDYDRLLEEAGDDSDGAVLA